MKKIISLSVAFIFAGLLFVVQVGFISPENISYLQLDLLTQTVNNGKKITTKGVVYYQVSNGKLVTRFSYPKELISITNSMGEMQTYDPEKNLLMQKNGLQYSSKGSFIYHFMNGKFSDMGLQEGGFIMDESKIEDGLSISVWKNGSVAKKSIEIELVHEKRFPIFMGQTEAGEVKSKIYYTNYQLIGNTKMPLNITEIQYSNGGADSTIIRKKYTNLRTNEQVNLQYLNFKIPAGAKLVELDK